MKWECVRGYPEKVEFRSYAAFKEGWPLTAGHRVRHVDLACLRGAGQFPQDPALASIESLELSFIKPEAIFAILASPHLKKLHRLAVAPHNPGPDFVERLVDLPVLAGLRSLDLNTADDKPLRTRDMKRLTGSPHLAGLRELTLQAWLDSGAMRELWQAGSLRGLTALDLSPALFSSSDSVQGGLEDLGDGSAMPRLDRFRWGYERGKDVGAALARATGWRLRWLDLSLVEIGDSGVRAIASTAHLAGLERLMLDRCRVSDEGAEALSASPHLRTLEFLSLKDNLIGSAGVAAFGRSTALGRLRALRLHGNPAPEGLVQMVEQRFRTGGPPVEPAPPKSLPAVPAPSAPLIGDADEDGLVRTIWADPFDDAAQAVYADWLEEHGSPDHAAAVREVGREAMRAFERIDARMMKEAPTPFRAWLTDESLIAVDIPVRALRSKAFASDGPAWLRRHHVAEIRPDGTPRNWSALFSAAWLEHTRGLNFSGRYFKALDELANSPRVEGLASLTLAVNDLPGDRFIALCRGPGLRSLCRLVFIRGWLSASCLRALAEAPFASHLRNLALGSVGGLEGMAVLASAPALRGIVTLDLSSAYLGDGDMKLLAETPGLDALSNLDVSRGQFTHLGLDALAGSSLLGHLNRLRIPTNPSATEALERLAQAVAETPRCRLVLSGKGLSPQIRRSLTDILGDRVIVE
jgi:uncharacterized protein (TIGR02996 family)